MTKKKKNDSAFSAGSFYFALIYKTTPIKLIRVCKLHKILAFLKKIVHGLR